MLRPKKGRDYNTGKLNRVETKKPGVILESLVDQCKIFASKSKN